MLDKLLSVKKNQDRRDVFAVVNSTMEQSVAVDLLLSVFSDGEALAKALVAEIARRKALEIEQPERVKAVRRKVAKHAN